MTHAALTDHPIELADVARLADADPLHTYELSGEGVLTVMPPPDSDHAAIVMRLAAWLMANGYPPERVLADAGVRVGAGGRRPDLLVRDDPRHNAVWLPPEHVVLAVEVESKGSRDVDRFTKAREYAAAGIAHYWRVTRRDGSVVVSLYRRTEDGVYDAWRIIALDQLLTEKPPLD
jgi:Uma2 family endonuclease